MRKIIYTLCGILLAHGFLPAQTQSPLEIKTGVYVIGISKISTQTGSYAMDFYLTLLCQRACEKDRDFKSGTVIESRKAQSRICLPLSWLALHVANALAI